MIFALVSRDDSKIRKHVKVPNRWTRIQPQHRVCDLASPCTLPHLCMDVVDLWQGQVFRSLDLHLWWLAYNLSYRSWQRDTSKCKQVHQTAKDLNSESLPFRLNNCCTDNCLDLIITHKQVIASNKVVSHVITCSTIYLLPQVQNLFWCVVNRK